MNSPKITTPPKKINPFDLRDEFLKDLYEISEVQASEMSTEDDETKLIEQNVDNEMMEIETQLRADPELDDPKRKTFEYFVKKIKQRLRDDWDLVIAITGGEGVGKSTLAVQLARGIDKSFTISKNISYLPDATEIFKKLNTDIAQFGAYVVDEAVRVLHKHDWFSAVQQKLNEWYATERWQNKCTILCIPRFANLNENFRNHRVNIWIHVIARGIAVVYLKDQDKDTDDPWNIKVNRKKKESFTRTKKISQVTSEMMLNGERALRNYLFDFTFLDLAPEEKEEYIRLKILSRDKLMEETEILEKAIRGLNQKKIQKESKFFKTEA